MIENHPSLDCWDKALSCFASTMTTRKNGLYIWASAIYCNLRTTCFYWSHNIGYSFSLILHIYTRVFLLYSLFFLFHIWEYNFCIGNYGNKVSG